jgi:Short C-terminal domain
MGFMRKALFLGTGGASGMVIKANSKKERTAKAAEKQIRLQKQMLNQQATQATQATVTTSRPRVLGDHEGWFNEIAAALADLGFSERTRNTASQWALGSDEGELQMEEEGGSTGHAFCIILFANDELAQLAVARAADMRLGQLKRTGRLVYIVLGPKRWASKLDLEQVNDVVSEIGVPAPRREDTTDDERVSLGPVAEIEQLAQLHTQGTLTDEEFAAAKAKVLGMEGNPS